MHIHTYTLCIEAHNDDIMTMGARQLQLAPKACTHRRLRLSESWCLVGHQCVLLKYCLGTAWVLLADCARFRSPACPELCLSNHGLPIGLQSAQWKQPPALTMACQSASTCTCVCGGGPTACVIPRLSPREGAPANNQVSSNTCTRTRLRAAASRLHEPSSHTRALRSSTSGKAQRNQRSPHAAWQWRHEHPAMCVCVWGGGGGAARGPVHPFAT